MAGVRKFLSNTFLFNFFNDSESDLLLSSTGVKQVRIGLEKEDYT